MKNKMSQTKIREQLIPMYRELYNVYYTLNAVCWNRKLPDCAIIMSNRLRACAAYASPDSRANCPMIVINYPFCTFYNDIYIIGLLSHEMTHIWQFSNGSSGGHGKDFKQEMQRVGIDFPYIRIIKNTPIITCFALHQMRKFNLTKSLKLMRKGDFGYQRQIDFYLNNKENLFQ